ncbi:MAG: YdcF family protein [Epsilonproteobacteria bacterium]|nr:hypothetical protein [Campylobacterota bacterium]NPA56338.1 YdcF family protein [Campylobacterota bacterium]
MIYTISKLVTMFLLPPGLFGTLLITGAFLWRRAARPLTISALLIWFSSSTPLAYLLLQPLENMDFPPSKTSPTAVVVLGGGTAAQEDPFPLSSSGMKRLLLGLLIAHRHNLPLIYTGFEGEYAQKSLEKIAREFNLPLRHCTTLERGCYLIEGESRDTYENARYTRALFEELQASPSIILVTSAFHMPRAYLLFKHFGFQIEARKTDYQLSATPLRWHTFISMGNLEATYKALHEYLGIVSLSLRGVEITLEPLPSHSEASHWHLQAGEH